MIAYIILLIIEHAVKNGISVPFSWAVYAGGRGYFKQILFSKKADITEQSCRLKSCVSCPMKTSKTFCSDTRFVREFGFCGVPFEPNGATCGCMLYYVDKNGGYVPAGKLVVRGESCPQGRW